jgi:tetratricopeptide (TPR) repeat protein
MTRARFALVLGGAGIAVILAAWFGFRPMQARVSGAFPPPTEPLASAATRADFVGAERCASCHAEQYRVWQTSTHARAGGPPSAATVIAPFNGGAIRFANARVTPRVRQGVYEFEVRPEADEPVVFRVDGVVGGGHMLGGGTQAFFMDLGDGSWRLIPFEWSRQAGVWFCNTNSRSGKGWAPISATTRLEECGDWPPSRVLGDHPRFGNCQSCHASQAIVALDSASQGYRTQFTSLAINCESCHGPGLRHVQLADAGSLGSSPDIGFGALATRDKDGSLRVCYQCHAIKDQLRPGFVSGDSLEAFYSTRLPLLGDRPLHPDGRIRTFAYQEGHQYSDCYLNGGMTCASCHDPHGQGYRTITGDPLPGRFDDAQCTSCHLSKAEGAIDHTKHPAAQVSCVSCHMPARQEPETRPGAARFAGRAVVPYARYDHTISIPRPALDSALQMVNACASCHATMSATQLEQAIAERWGEIKPIAPVIAAQLRAREGLSAGDAAPLLLGSAGEATPNAFARFAGVSRFFETYIALDTELPDAVETRLRELAGSADADIRAAALASLHLAQGSDRRTRRALAAALRAEQSRDVALRSRWAIMLGFAGDRWMGTGATGSAIAAYERALEVQPSNARLQASLGNALREAGEPTRAIAAYQRSIAIEPRQPLTWVNLGIALAQAGDAQGAVTAYVRAIAIDAAEPLAWFNLANVTLLRGDMAKAREFYGRALELDPALTEAHFQLARVGLLTRDSVAALRHLRRGLAFDSSNAEARQAADDLGRRLDDRRQRD